MVTRFDLFEAVRLVAAGRTRDRASGQECSGTSPLLAARPGSSSTTSHSSKLPAKRCAPVQRVLLRSRRRQDLFHRRPNGKLIEGRQLPGSLSKARADNVLIKGLVIEKYYNPAGRARWGATKARAGRWSAQELALNSGVARRGGNERCDCRLQNPPQQRGQLGATAAGTDMPDRGEQDKREQTSMVSTSMGSRRPRDDRQ